jgi:hypothetical protein
MVLTDRAVWFLGGERDAGIYMAGFWFKGSQNADENFACRSLESTYPSDKMGVCRMIDGIP